ncbi:MAG: DUF5979 domain-containing protein [Micrococcales bacterium]|nr:DUF5979 domain-containing protein [Micrococcales bacterium]
MATTRFGSVNNPKRWIAATALAGLVFAGLATSAAQANPPPEDVTATPVLHKNTSDSQVVPGQSFTYTITIGCSSITDRGCRDAVLTDVVPAPFVVTGAVALGGTNSGDATYAGNIVTVVWTTPLGDGTIGMLDNTTSTVQITAELPLDASYDFNGRPVLNDAVMTGSNFDDVHDQVAVTPLIPKVLETTPTKTLDPPTLVALLDEAVTAVLAGTNNSNGSVESLAIQDPVDPTATPNPFEYLEFQSFGSVVPPAGADPGQTTYEVYVDTGGGVYDWVDAPGGVLPAGVTGDMVRGTRVTFYGLIPPGETGTVELNLALTADGVALGDGALIDNSVLSEVTLGGDSATGTANDSLVLRDNQVWVGATKEFNPYWVLAGDSSTVTLGASNQSSIQITTLTITEPSSGTFPTEYTFGGFTAGIRYPAGALSGVVTVWIGTTPYPVPFGDGDTPDIATEIAPALLSEVEWFEVTFTGDILAGGDTEIVFDVITDPTTPGVTPLTNEVGVHGDNGSASDDATAQDDLYIYDEVIEPYVNKSVRPTPILGVPGQYVTVSLEGGLTDWPDPPTTMTGSTGSANQIVIQDPQDPVEPNDWWNAFDLYAVSQTPIPACAELTVEVYDTTTSAWVWWFGPILGGTIYSEVFPGPQATTGGIRFIYDYVDTPPCPAGGFPPGTDLAPNFVSQLRDDGRYNPGPPFSDTSSTFVPNCAQTDATSPNDPIVSPGQATMPPGTCPEIEILPVQPGQGQDMIDKSFGQSSSGGIKSVIARSGDTIPSVLSWSTGGYSNLDSVEITDIIDPAGTALADSIFDAFDLHTIQAITPATDPLIAYDQVQAVYLYNRTTSTWEPAANSPCPAGCDGQMPAITLTAAEMETTIGVQLVIIESPNRDTALQANPAGPPVGSGVASSFGYSRPITLVWQVRDNRRSDFSPVLGDEWYNLPDEGDVLNTVGITGYLPDGSTQEDTASDDVLIIDVPLTTITNKTWSGGPIAVPDSPSGLTPDQFPVSRITVTTRNTTPARVDQLVITDPAPGAVAPDTDAFNAFDLISIVSITPPAGADPANTVVTLYCTGGAEYDFDTTTALALTFTTMPCADVIGIQVSFDGRIASGGIGEIVFDMRLRAIYRDTGGQVSAADGPLFNRAEGVIADVDSPGPCPPPPGARYECDQASTNIPLANPSFGVVASKTISPSQQYEGDYAPVTVTLGGQPTGSARAWTMVLADDDPAFWNAFDFVGMDPSWAFAPPTGRVQVCYYWDGDFSPANVAAGASAVGGTEVCQQLAQIGDIAMAVSWLTAQMATLPADAIHGLQFEFWTADGSGWANPSNPVVTVPFVVERRVTMRTGDPTPTTRSDQTAAPGQDQAGIFVDDMTVDAESVIVSGGQRLLADDAANAQYRHLHDTVALSVVKQPQGAVPPGKVIPFTLTFTNTGMLPLVDPIFSDRLPTDGTGPQLIFDPDADPTVPPWSFALAGAAPSPPNGLPLPTSPNDVTVDQTSVPNVIYFHMPPGSVLEPGQTYTITINLMLRPGLETTDQAQNWAAIDIGGLPLDSCVSTEDPITHECMDDSTVWPMAAPALSTIKYVKGDVLPSLAAPLSGVPDVVSSINNYDCTGQATPDGFYRAPCIPVTLPGDTETWRFSITNAGTIPLTELVSIDNLPTPGDQGLIVILPRQSAWQPTYADWFDKTGLPAGATFDVYTSPLSLPCTADLDPQGVPCALADWTEWDLTPDPTAVRSLKFVIKFPPGEEFKPGDTLSIEFKTATTPNRLNAANYPVAWNTVATGGLADDAGTKLTVPATEGRRVGVTYATGPILLKKIVTGPAASLAPLNFPVQLVCTVAGVPMSGLPIITLVANGPEVRLDGLPVGAECTATEQWWGQTSHQIGTATVGGPLDPIGLITVTNDFQTASLQIRKQVDTPALDANGDPVVYGPFSFAVSCTYLGSPVYADGYDLTHPMEEDLWDGNTWSLAGETPTGTPLMPTGTECTVTETNSAGALDTEMVVTDAQGNQTTVPGNQATVTIDDLFTVEVLGINTFGAGSLELLKTVTGPAAGQFGNGPFVFNVLCTLDTGSGPATVFDGDVTLTGPNNLSATIDFIADGADCDITEVNTGGATSTVITPTTVTIGNTTTVTVDITNTFNAADLTVHKAVTGAGASLWGAGPFEVTLDCLDANGNSVALPGGATRILSNQNSFTAAYSPLLHGLVCTLTETGTGGATSYTVTDSTGQVVTDFTIVQNQDVELWVTNTFDLGTITVQKTVSGTRAASLTNASFMVWLDCQLQGRAIAIPGGAARQLKAGAQVVYQDLPVGAQCTVTETDRGGARTSTVTYVGTNQPFATVAANSTALVTVNNDFANLAFTGSDWLNLLIWAFAGIGGGLAIRHRRQPTGQRPGRRLAKHRA